MAIEIQMEKTVKTGAKRRVWLVLAFLLAAALVVLVWEPVQRRLAVELILRSETLDESVFGELVQSSDQPVSLILRSWNTQKIPHRQAVMGLLKDWARTNGMAFSQFEQIVLAAAVDV